MTRSSARSLVSHPSGRQTGGRWKFTYQHSSVPPESNIWETENQRWETTRSTTPVHCQAELTSSQSPRASASRAASRSARSPVSSD